MASLSLLNQRPQVSSDSYPVVNEFVLKLASRCNIQCTYCYWFEDPLVLKSPKFLSDANLELFLKKLEKHIHRYSLDKVSIAFHGGEPTLYPLTKFQQLCQQLRDIENQSQCKVQLSMQSNALLINDDWIKVIKQYGIRLGVSLDGSKLVHDQYRIDARGRGTFKRTTDQIEYLKHNAIDVYLLSVASPEVSAREQMALFVDHLNIKDFDILIPHQHHDNAHSHEQTSISDYYVELFDLYLDRYLDLGVNIRLLDGIMCQLVGGKSSIQGYGFISTVTLLTDGHLEATDDLRMIKNLPVSKIHITSHQLQQVTEDPLWQSVYSSSINLAPKCEQCEFKFTCGAGPMVTRWSNTNQFNNPSVFCEDFISLFKHINQRLEPYYQLRKIKTNHHNKALITA